MTKLNILNVFAVTGILLLFSCQPTVKKELILNSLFSDHMVLQQQQEVMLWGKYTPKEKISVKANWGSESTTKVDENGNWRLNITTPEAGGPFEVSISTRDTTITLVDVMVGEVWLASGQSNMEMTLEGYLPNEPIDNNLEEIAAADYPDIRSYKVVRASSQTPLNQSEGQWKVTSPKNANKFSATAYFFARKLHNELNVPIGIIDSDWGGTPVESWISLEKIKQLGEFEEEVVLIQKLEKLQVDGVLVSTSSETKNFDHLKKLQKKGIPIVIFDRDCPGVKADKVLVDDYSGAFEAVEFLIQSGCKKIAHLGGPHNSSTSKHRLKGYLDALKKHKIPIKKEYIHHVSGFTSKSGIKTSKDLLKLNNPPDAIFAVNDNIAIAAMSVAQKMNIKIPKELSIVGFNDDPHSSFVSPSLSSVLQPVFSIGMLSARILLHHLKDVNAKIEFRHEVFKTELITRESSKLL